MAKRPMPDLAIARKLLDYDPETGILTWRVRDSEMFKSDLVAASWNERFAGKQAGGLTSGGYICVRILRAQLMAHRLAWFITHGTEPESLDHINGDTADNRLCNLRAVTHSENTRNAARRCDNTSGACGVKWHWQARLWTARITVDGKRMSLGYFRNKEDAIAARKAAERKYGFHENHGREAVSAL